MNGRNVNTMIFNWTDLGSTVPVPCYSVDISVNWIKANGTQGNYVDTVTFPNVLAGVPVQRLRRYMQKIILSEVRIQLGIDEAEE